MTSPIPDRAVLEGLLERVRSAPVAEAEKRDGRADAAVRALEEDIYCDLGGCPVSEDGMQNAYRAPAYLRSLDAALELVERILPGWQWMVRGGWAKLWTPGGRPPGNDFDAFGATPALALCAALLTALMRPVRGMERDMKISELIRGLEILRPHYKDGDGYYIGAEHDQFFAYATDTPLNDREVAEMKALGWFQPDAPDGEDESDASTSPYAAEEGWSAWT